MEQKDKKTSEILKEIAIKTLEKMGFEAEIIIEEKDEAELSQRIVCNIKTDESSFLIGQHGGNLEALEHIMRVLVRKKTEDKLKFIVDINGYRKERNDSVVSLAKSMAEKALVEKRAVILRPMSAYERRLVHLELAENAQVVTESTGENGNRKVIIKPVGLV